MIGVKELLELFQAMERQHWGYEWGAARKGCVDCSGAFVYAYKRLDDAKIAIHGSNYIARKACGGMLPLSRAKPGMAAFKKREPGNAKYALPARYKKGGAMYNGDLNDYYHIGLVDEDTGYILNAQSAAAGFVRSPITQNWSGVAYLSNVDYKEEGKPMEKLYDAKVTAERGSTVRMRKIPDKTGEIAAKVPVGTLVPVYEDAEGWARIEYGGVNGYMMDEFLEKAEDDLLSDNGSTGDADKQLARIEEKLDRVLCLLGDAEGGQDDGEAQSK